MSGAWEAAARLEVLSEGWLVYGTWPGRVWVWIGVGVFAVAFGLRARLGGLSGGEGAVALGSLGIGAALGSLGIGAGASSMAGYGGALVASWALSRGLTVSWGRLADLAAPAALLGAATARIGCLWRGCDFGEPTHSTWGVVHPWGTAAFRWLYETGQVGALSRVGVAMHPFALYEALPVLLLGLWTCASGPPPQHGQTAWGCAWGYATIRLVAERYRADPPLVAFPWGEGSALVVWCAGLSLMSAAAWCMTSNTRMHDVQHPDA